MKFDTPATTNPIDQLKVVGKPVDRIDGPLKTTGVAPYAYERHAVAPNTAFGYVVGAGIAKGRLASMDLRAARAAPGVLAVVTARNAGKLGKGTFNTARLLGGPEIEHYHQAIALVVAYLVARQTVPGSQALGYLATAPVAIPGIVLGVGLFLSYSHPSLMLYGTLWILLIAFLTIEMPAG